MIANDFYIEHASFEKDLPDLRLVREEVFVLEQLVSREEEWDDLDAVSHHVLARDNSGNPIGTGRLTPDHKIGRMAVLKAWRGHGVGAALLRTLIERARELRFPEVHMNAQVDAIEFYEKLGFTVYGDEFIEANIRHRSMQMTLPPLGTPDRPGDHVGVRPDSKLTVIETREQAHLAVLELLGVTRREVCIYTRDLDAALFDTPETLEALRRISTEGRGASIRILVQDPSLAVQQNHRLIGLAQRLTSVFALRVPIEETDLQYASAFLLNDQRGYYFRPLGSRFDGESNTYAPGKHKQLLDYFDQVWERAEPSAELRRLEL